jgi:hypothetical protein
MFHASFQPPAGLEMYCNQIQEFAFLCGDRLRKQICPLQENPLQIVPLVRIAPENTMPLDKSQQVGRLPRFAVGTEIRSGEPKASDTTDRPDKRSPVVLNPRDKTRHALVLKHERLALQAPTDF